MKKVFTLNSESDSVVYLSSKDKKLCKLFSLIGEITYVPYSDDPFVFLADTIVGQMLSSKVADIICSRVHNLCGTKVTPSAVSQLSTDVLREAGVSYSKSEYLHNLANAVLTNSIDLNSLSEDSDKDVFKKLTSIRGIGSWSAKMYLIFVLNRQNILPYEDGAFMQSYSWLYNTSDLKPSSIKKKCKKWEPYSSIAARYLYKALDWGYTKTPFNQQ